MLLELQHLELQRGTKHALHPLNLKLEKGITGLLGPNGAGKSTLMNVLAGITRPTKGTLRLDGREISGRDRAYRSLIGYLPQQAGVIPQLTGREFLLYMAALKGLERTEARNKSAELLEMFHLTAVANQQIRTYSGGMKQRLAIAQSLLNAPRLLLLDEPSVGLDPDERLALKRVLAETAKEAVVAVHAHRLRCGERCRTAAYSEAEADARLRNTGRADRLARGKGLGAAAARRARSGSAAPLRLRHGPCFRRRSGGTCARTGQASP